MKHLVVIIVMFLTGAIIAQDFQGVATYKSQTKFDIKLDSTKANSVMQKQLIEMIKKQSEKTYKLTFNKEESFYKEEESLAPPKPSAMSISISFSSGSDAMYKNIKENRYTNQNESYSKLFLIKDELKKIDWILGSETKNIGEYTCYKATFTREQKVFVSMKSSDEDDSETEEEEEEEEKEPEMKTVTTTAWYTPQIPLSVGPENYYGLPGLILEVNDGKTTLICSKIVINPEDKVKIIEPKKGKEISQKEYDKIMKKKNEEMMERYRSKRGDDDNHFSIEIKG